jgi:hypothetical protein
VRKVTLPNRYSDHSKTPAFFIERKTLRENLPLTPRLKCWKK